MKYKLGDLTVKRWNDWDSVPRDPFILFGGNILASATATQVFIASALTTIAVSVVTSWALSALAPKPRSVTAEQGLIFNARDPAAPQQIVYGKVRKGGYITYVESTGSDNKFLHMILTLAGHEVNAINKVFINDEEVTIGADHFVSDSRWKDGNNKKVYIRKFLGADNQNVYTTLNALSNGPNWEVDGSAPSNNEDSNFKGEGIACLYVRMEYNANVFAEGIPLFTAEVEGKKVYDPRTSTTAYSANAALCIRDYLVSTYGLDNDGATDDATNATFDVAADTCDEDVTLAGGGTEKRYEINGVVDLNRSPSDILGDMVTACAGTLFWGVGKWHLKVGEYISPVKTFTLDDLRSEINLQTKVSRRDNFNIVRGVFNDAANGYIVADYPQIRSETFIGNDNDIENALDLPLPFTTSSATAQRLAKMTLFRGREQMTMSADFSLEAFEVEVGDIIQLTIDRYGFSSKDFEVIGWKLLNGNEGDLRVNLTLRETSSSAFSWTAEEADITSNNSTLPDPRAGLTISNLAVSDQNTNITSDGTHTVTASLAWDDVDSAYLNHYLVGYKNNATGIFAKSTTDDNTFETGLLVDGDSYTFVVAAVTDAGYVGAQASVTFTAEADTTAPAVPTSVAVDAGYRSNVVKWTNPTDDDFKEVDVYVNTTDNSGTATKLGSTAGTSFTHAGLAQNVTRYYWVKSKDFTGNASAFSTGANGTTLADPAEGVQGTDGDTVISGRVFYQILQSSAPSTPSATSYDVSTASFTGLTTDWALTQPQIDITDTSIKEWSSAFTVTIDGSDDTQTIVFTTPTGAIQVADDIESDNYSAGSSGWKIERDTGFAEFGSAAIRGTLTVGQVPQLTSAKISDLNSIATSGDYGDLSNTPDLSAYATTAQLGTKNTTFTQLSTNTPTANETGDLWYQTDTRIFKRWSGSAWTDVTLTADSIVAGTIDADEVTINNLDVNNVTAGTLSAAHIKLTGSELENSSDILRVKTGGIGTLNVVTRGITNTEGTNPTDVTYTSSTTTTIDSFSTTEANTFCIVSATCNLYGSGTGLSFSFGILVDGVTIETFVNSQTDDYANLNAVRFTGALQKKIVVASAGSHSVGVKALVFGSDSLKVTNLNVTVTILKR
jgi:hypothetical protein